MRFIVGWGRVYLHDQLLADIVGETRPYISAINLHSHCLLGGGGFIYIIHYWLILLVKPAPTFLQKICIAIVCWAGRVYLHHPLLADIFGETRPYYATINLHSHYLLGGDGFIYIINYGLILLVKPAPTSLNLTDLRSPDKRTDNTVKIFSQRISHSLKFPLAAFSINFSHQHI